MEKLTQNFKIEYVKGDTYALAIKFKNITEDLSKAYLTVKENPDDSPIIQKSLGAGISKIDDRAYKNEKTYKIQLQPADTVNVEPKVQYLYDVQVTVGNVVKTVLKGVFVLGSTITGTNGITTQEIEVEVDDELETELATVPATNGIEYEQDPVACAKIGDITTLTTTNKETVVKAVNEVKKGVNEIEDGTTVVPKASNVLSQINGQNISDIFEDDGTTAKNASNVMGKINGNLITNIFEDDGTTAKNATKVNNLEIKQDENGVLKNGDIVIPQRKVLWSDENGVLVDSETKQIITLNESLEAGDIIEVEGIINGNKRRIYKFEVNSSESGGYVSHTVTENYVNAPGSIPDGQAIYCMYETFIEINGENLRFGQYYYTSFRLPSALNGGIGLHSYSRGNTTLYKVTKIIE